MEVGDNLGGEEGLNLLLLIFEGGAIKDTEFVMIGLGGISEY